MIGQASVVYAEVLADEVSESLTTTPFALLSPVLTPAPMSKHSIQRRQSTSFI